MTDPNLIADLIRAGIDPDLIGRVANAIASNYVVIRENSAENPRNSADEKRRAYDRERKRNPRNSAENPRNSAESAKTPLTIEDIKNSKRKGERISAEWKPSDDDLSFASSKGLPQSRLDLEAEKFRNYWMAKTGTAAVKLDWPATWRNWVLQALERVPGIQSPSTVVQLQAPEHGHPMKGGGVYVMDGTPERDAWDKADRAAGKIPRARDKRGGWTFPTRWPDEMKMSAEKRDG